MPDSIERLRRALASNDLEAAQSAFEEFETTWANTAKGPDRLQHFAKLIDLGHLSAELVHELHQPMTGVKAFAQRIAEVPGDATSVLRRATFIVDQCLRMETFLDRVGVYARGGMDDVLRPCSVNDELRAAVELVKLEPKQSKVSVSCDLEVVPDVEVGPGGLQQIFINLLTNAREAFPDERGSIRIHSAVAHGQVEVFVEDDGPGVPEEARQHLFAPFVTTKPTGTGLGLHLSRRIAERAGGTLELLESTECTIFRLQLPLPASHRVEGPSSLTRAF